MSSKVPEKWDMEVDVVVVGWGAAGTATAVTAHDAGAEVLILEKMPRGGGNSRVCGGNILIPKSMDFVKYLDTLSFKTTEREIIETYVKASIETGDWIKEMGGEIQIFTPLSMAYPETSAGAGFPWVDGGEAAVKYTIKGDEGEPPSARLWKFCSGIVEKRGIKVLTGTPAKEIIRRDDAEVLGVEAESEGKRIFVKAKKAVVLTSGGYENEPAMKWDYLPAKPVMFLGNPGNTGDGVKMVQKIGADIWHMTRLSCGIGFQVPEFEAAFWITFLTPGFIIVDKHGRRFIDEAGVEIHEWYRELSYFDIERMEFPRVPLWAIFDDNVRRKGPIVRDTTGYNRDLYQWSLDNSKEIKKGWILQDKKVSNLAKKMEVEPSVLEETVANYSEYCKTGKDTEFGRAREHLKDFEMPLHAMRLWPALINTQGGPRRDKESRVIDPDGKPIPRLYAAGELGSIWGYLYQGSCNIGECFAFGRIAGKNAADEELLS